MKTKFLKLLIPMSFIFVLSTTFVNAKEIHLNKWEPQGIAKVPNKVSYMLGDKLDLAGLKINFIRYIKNGNRVETEIKQVEMFPNTTKNGWELLDNKLVFNNVGIYNIQLRLKLIDPSLQYDLMYPEKVEVDDNNIIINKSVILEKEEVLSEDKEKIKQELEEE